MDNDSLKFTMVIPTYWSRESSIGWMEGDDIYDHPTPLDVEGTLARTLKSIDILKDKDFNLIVIAISTSKDIERLVEDKVKTILRECSCDIETYFFAPSHQSNLKSSIIEKGKKDYSSLLSLHGYSNIRNMCIFLPHVLGSDVAILIDDDEIFEDPHYIKKVRDFIGKNIDGEMIYGITGHVINPDGNYKVKKKFQPWMKYWPKNEKMNETFDNIVRKQPRLKKASLALGGNMVIHKNLFSTVPFDPNITRGEDTDFLINARMLGFNFFSDNKLTIKHLPPQKSHPSWMRIREDIYRFIYERAKITGQKEMNGIIRVDSTDLEPYPGYFLGEDLEEKIEDACKLLSEEYLSKGDIHGSNEVLRNITIAKLDAVPNFDPFIKFCILQKKWKGLMDFIEKGSCKSNMPKIITRME